MAMNGATRVYQHKKRWVTADNYEVIQAARDQAREPGVGTPDYWWCYDTPIEVLIERLGLKLYGRDGGYACRCPNHRGVGDTSLNIRHLPDGRVIGLPGGDVLTFGKSVIYCFGGCDRDDVADAVATILETAIDSWS